MYAYLNLTCNQGPRTSALPCLTCPVSTEGREKKRKENSEKGRDRERMKGEEIGKENSGKERDREEKKQ